MRQGRGLSLLEAVIALAITGMVIGLLWVAMAPVVRQQKINTTASAVILLANQVRKLYGDQTITNTTNLSEATLIQAGLMPASFLRDEVYVENIYHSLSSTGKKRLVLFKPGGSYSSVNNVFAVRMENVGADYCAAFLRAIAGTRNMAAQNQIIGVYVGGNSVMDSNQAVPATLAEAACNTNNNLLQIFFSK